MEDKTIWEEAFVVGFQQGYASRVADCANWHSTPTQLEANAEAAYQRWWQERQNRPYSINSGTF